MLGNSFFKRNYTLIKWNTTKTISKCRQKLLIESPIVLSYIHISFLSSPSGSLAESEEKTVVVKRSR